MQSSAQHYELSQLSLSLESVKSSLNEVSEVSARVEKKLDEVLSLVSKLENNFSEILNESEQELEEEEE